MTTKKNLKSTAGIKPETSKSDKSINRVDITSLDYPVSDGCSTKYVYDIPQLSIPKTILFEDFLCTRPLATIDLKHWMLSNDLFQVLSSQHLQMTSLCLDHTLNLTADLFRLFRGHSSIKRLSLDHVACVIDRDMMEVIASMKSLTYLRLSHNSLQSDIFKILSTNCNALRAINLSHCKGIDDFSLYALGQLIERFRALDSIDLSYCMDFGDEGVVSLLTAGRFILQEIKLSGCIHLTNLSLAGFRNKLAQLRVLDLEGMHTSVTAYEYLTEGAKNITHLNIGSNEFLDDNTLILLGKHCRLIEKIHLNNCLNISDDGVVGFFEGYMDMMDLSTHNVLPVCLLKYITLSNSVQIGSKAVESIARHGVHLEEVYLDGLSKVSPQALTLLYTLCSQLQSFSMMSILSGTTKHRKSTIPHIDDSVLLAHKARKLASITLSGACKITDAGLEAILKYCPTLTNVDVCFINSLTDSTLVNMYKYNSTLISLNVSGCVHMSDYGMQIFCQGRYQSTLTSLQFNGCNKLTDKSIVCLQNFPNLRTLSMKSVDLVTDFSLKQIFSVLTQLVNVDIMNCDYITLPVVTTLCKSNQQLQHVNIQKCSISSHEFFHNSKMQTILPFAIPYRTEFVPRPMHIQVYNKYIFTLLRLSKFVYKLQHFTHIVTRSRWTRLIRQEKRARRMYLKKHLVAWTSYFRVNRRRSRVVNRLSAVYIIQNQLKRWYTQHQAKKKLFQLRIQKYAVLTVQAVLRGHLTRKRYRVIFAKYEYFTDKIGMLFYKYFVIWHKRQLIYLLVHLQAFFRMVPHRIRFWKVKYNIHPLQRKAKMLWRIKQHEIQKAKKQAQVHMQQQANLNRAAKVIQKNLKNKMFNYYMSKFILVTCIYYRTKYDEEKYFSTVIQRYVRGWLVRLRIRRAKLYENLSLESAVLIQSTYRMYVSRARYLHRLAHKRKVYLHLRQVFKYSKPKLRLGVYVKRIQKRARMYIWRCKVYRGAVQMQRLHRGYRGRKAWWDIIQGVYHKYACKIQGAYHIHRCRVKRKEMKARQHMAAFRIYLMVDRFFEVQRKMKRRTEAERLARVSIESMKKEQVTKRREFFVSKIRDAFQNSQAMKIQRVYRAHQERKREHIRSLLREGSSSSLHSGDFSVNSLSSLAKVPVASKLAQKLIKPIRAMQDTLGKIKTVFKPQELIPESDHKKFVNAVLTYQVRSILQEGVLDLHMTVGEAELKTFQSHQKNMKNAHLPFFVMLPEDITGFIQMDVFLWVLYGTGENCICELDVKRRPAHTSNAAMKIREDHLKGEGVKLIWHPQLHFELHAERSVRQGKAAFAIQNLVICTTPEQHTQLSQYASLMTCICDLQAVGIYGISLWCTQRKPREEEVGGLYRFTRITAFEWFDARMERVIKSFNLMEDDVFTIRRTFDEIIGGRPRETIRIEDIFNFLNLPCNQVARWAVLAVEPAHPKEITFSEYLHFVCYFIMLSAKDLARFLFMQADSAHQHFLKREHFKTLMYILGEDGTFNVRIWELQYDDYYDPKLKNMFVRNFLDFCTNNQGVLWQPQKIQQKLILTNLGKNYWAKKSEQYRVIRENMGVKLM